jgi:erythronate-4-phosphate dehydrogenase
MALRILADENIPFAREAFSTLGDVEMISGRSATREMLRDCDVFACRSVTKIGRELLEGSRVRFVGTATIGFDHVDVGYLRERGIAFASAPGSNANSVAEYIAAAMLVLARRGGFTLEGTTIGVVGVGNVGSRVVNKAEALGMRVLQNDPPLARQTGDPRFLPLDALLDADFLTFHVPLTREGPDATHHLVDAAFLRRMKPSAVLLNSSRGAVVDGSALRDALGRRRIAAAVLDVWEGEPVFDAELLAEVAIGTPHVAGYSFDGKVAATEMIYRAACEAIGVAPTWDPAAIMPPPGHPRLEIQCAGRADEDVLREAVLTVYDIEADDRALRQSPQSPAERGAYFDRLRRVYPERREFHNTTLALSGASERLKAKLAGIGFRV